MTFEISFFFFLELVDFVRGVFCFQDPKRGEKRVYNKDIQIFGVWRVKSVCGLDVSTLGCFFKVPYEVTYGLTYRSRRGVWNSVYACFNKGLVKFWGNFVLLYGRFIIKAPKKDGRLIRSRQGE